MSRKVIVLGGGPIGVEAALAAAKQGFDVELFEAGALGAHVLQWGHVRFFSPWRLNRSALGAASLAARGVTLEDAEVFPTGQEFVSQYLVPLSEDPSLAGRVHVGTRVLGVSRAHALKGHFIGDKSRAEAPFLVMVADERGHDRYVQADIVIDTTGAYGQPNALGAGGLPALGERQHEARFIERYIPKLDAQDQASYEGKRVLVVGAGYSAVTSLDLLLKLRQRSPQTALMWLIQGQEPPYEILEDDPLPQRKRLAKLGNDVFSGDVDGVQVFGGGQIVQLEAREDGALDVVIVQGGQLKRVVVDRVVANVGYRPDLELYRELQVHLCYASEGPMKLAAALLAAGGGGGDCLAQTAQGVETLFSPEPDFFVLGAKSYGRGSAFLLKIGHEQIEALMAHLVAQPKASVSSGAAWPEDGAARAAF